MPRKFLPFQEHYSNRIFAKLHCKQIRDLAVVEKTLSSDLRLYFVGLGRISNKGHAPFERGELASLVGTENRNLRKVIRKLVVARALAPESTVRCLVYPIEMVTVSIHRGSDSCPEHGTHRPWSSEINNWVDDYPQDTTEDIELVDVFEVVQVQNGPFEEFESQFMGTLSSEL
jgi:hypothetical protein